MRALNKHSAWPVHRQLPVIIVFFLLPSICWAAPGASPQSNDTAMTAAQEFLDYLLTPKTNITTDGKAQERWLSGSLRRLLGETAQAVGAVRTLPGWSDEPEPLVPYNSTFLDNWDYPSYCHAGRPEKNAGPYTAVPVDCAWGPQTNYPGETRHGVFWVKQEAGEWRIFNIRWGKSMYTEDYDLAQFLDALRDDAIKQFAYPDGPNGPYQDWVSVHLRLATEMESLTLASCAKARVELSAAPGHCPCCGGGPVAPVVYGKPSDDLLRAAEAKKVILAGCAITGNDPAWRCTACQASFYKAK